MGASYDDSVLRRSIDKLKDLMDKDNQTILTEISLYIAKKAVAFCPPKTKSQGQKAVVRDIDKLYLDNNKLIQWADSKGNVAVAKRISDVVKRGDYGAAQAIFRNTPHLRNIEVTAFTPDMHRKLRDKRGRVNLKAPRYFLTNPGYMKQYKEYEKKVVGFAKASFAGWVRTLGGSVPQWVGQWANNVVENNSGNRFLPKIVMTSTVKYIMDLSDRNNVIQRAVDNGAKNMVARAKYLLKEAKSKAGFK